MSAMKDTNLVLAKILNCAVQNGLSHWNLNFEALELTDNFRTYFYPAVRWLEAEGLIRVESYNQTLGDLAGGSVSNISLTSLGMSVLAVEIDIAGTQEPLAEKVKKVSEGKVDYHKIGDALGGTIGGIIKSLSG